MRSFVKSRLRKQRELELTPAVRELERAYVDEALKRCDENVMRAAEMLGVSRSSIYRILEQSEETTVRKRRANARG